MIRIPTAGIATNIAQPEIQSVLCRGFSDSYFQNSAHRQVFGPDTEIPHSVINHGSMTCPRKTLCPGSTLKTPILMEFYLPSHYEIH